MIDGAENCFRDLPGCDQSVRSKKGAGFLVAYRSFFPGPHRRSVMKGAIVLGVVALVASCVFTQDVFAQRTGSVEGSYRAVAPGHGGPPRVVVRPLRWAGHPRLVYYPYSDLPYVAPGTAPFLLAGHAGIIDSCWGWYRYQWVNFCTGNVPRF